MSDRHQPQMHATLDGKLVPVRSIAWLDDLKRRVNEAKYAMDRARSNARAYAAEARRHKMHLEDCRREYKAARSSNDRK